MVETLALAVITAVISFYFGQQTERRKSKVEEYGRFIQAITNLSLIAEKSVDDPEVRKFTLQGNEAKAKIILHCGWKVMESLERYSRVSSNDNVGLAREYCKLVATMRADLSLLPMSKSRETYFVSAAQTIMLDAHS